jgi:L,D-transpeptidase-like protein
VRSPKALAGGHRRRAVRKIAVLLGPSLALAGGGDGPQPVERLDHPGVRSYYAFVNHRRVARTRPSTAAPAVARLRLRTEEGTDELLLVLARTTDPAGRTWLRVRLPVSANNSTGWVVASALGDLQPVRTWLRVDTRRLRATLVKAGRVVFRAAIGVGRPRWPTPRGEFYIRDKLTGYGRPGSFYGPVAFGTSARSKTLTDWPGGAIVGIHGTNLPNLIPGRISHGCVRLRNRDILRLARLMPVGTPLTIR